jgi:hypothetical protein
MELSVVVWFCMILAAAAAVVTTSESEFEEGDSCGAPGKAAELNITVCDFMAEHCDDWHARVQMYSNISMLYQLRGS